MLKRFGMVASVLALLAVALAGCKNGMLGEDEATVNGLRDVGGRTAKVTITNFAGDGNGATRSVVDGPLRTIYPEAVDLTQAGDYVFVATGTNNRVEMDAKIVPVDPTSGRVDLAGLNPGTWTITITAYSKQLLTGVGGVDQADVTQVIAQADNCAVLSGTGYVDLRNSNSDVKITLTPDGMGTRGNVEVDFTLHTDDQTKINQNNYEVHIALYNGSTLVGNNENVSTTARLAADITYPRAEVNVGVYVIRVTISDTTKKNGPWVWSDTLYVEGNRDTNPNAPIQLPKLIDEAPKEPKNFAVYYNPTTVDKNTGSYTATFAWDRDSFNEQGFELQIYDITDKYSYDGGMKYDQNIFTDAKNLFDTVALPDEDTKGLKTKDSMGTDVTYPKYAGGNLMAASTYVDYTLQTGHVYVFRLRSENSTGQSPWVYFADAGTEPGAKARHPNTGDLDRIEQKVAGVFTVTYDLQDTFVLAALNDTLPDSEIKTSTEVVEYLPTTPYNILYLPKDDYLLFKEGATGNADTLNPLHVSGWSGWVDAYDNVIQFDNVRNTYDKWSNLTLTTVGGASGKSAMLDIISAGTFGNLLTSGEKVLLKLQDNNTNPPTWTDNEKLTGYSNDVKAATKGFGKVNTDFALNIATDNSTRYLYFTVGENVGGGQIEAGKLKAAGDREVTVDKMEFTLEENGKVSASGQGSPVGVVDLNGLQSGFYTLRIVAYNTHGYCFTFQTQIIVKYDTDIIQ